MIAEEHSSWQFLGLYVNQTLSEKMQQYTQRYLTFLTKLKHVNKLYMSGSWCDSHVPVWLLSEVDFDTSALHPSSVFFSLGVFHLVSSLPSKP